MRRSVLALAAVAGLAPSALAAPPDPFGEKSTCGFGTKLHFVSTPKQAAAQALKEEKLVFILHVSGHFEDPGLT